VRALGRSLADLDRWAARLDGGMRDVSFPVVRVAERRVPALPAGLIDRVARTIQPTGGST
jgi:hypothetical protein